MDEEVKSLGKVLDDFPIGATTLAEANESNVDDMKMVLNVLNGKAMVNTALLSLSKEKKSTSSSYSIEIDSEMEYLEEQKKELEKAAAKITMHQAAFNTVILNANERLTKAAHDSNLTSKIEPLQSLLKRLRELHQRRVKLTTELESELVAHKKDLAEHKVPNSHQSEGPLNYKIKASNIMREILLGCIVDQPSVLVDDKYVDLLEYLRIPVTADNVADVYQRLNLRGELDLLVESDSSSESEASDLCPSGFSPTEKTSLS